MTTTELEAVRAKTLAALQTVEDASASPVLLAVVREFSNEANKAVGLGEDDRAWEAVVELEQAGDSAKAAAEADVDTAAATAVPCWTHLRDLHAQSRVRYRGQVTLRASRPTNRRVTRATTSRSPHRTPAIAQPSA